MQQYLSGSRIFNLFLVLFTKFKWHFSLNKDLVCNVVWLNGNAIKLVGIRYVLFVKPGSNKTPFDIIICKIASYNNNQC